ncbi:serine protease, S1-C subfamily, contains C-terminal PDZ domain [Anaerocolumna jejuensis DSM 15929]|uniref:Serine protease, S1-C subfamily, contains C-terminal PDZ domain n=1 Tax=Anaerocolumna jejuensis DSM 15929 TaxID=1121322 RepID=A0A1M7BQX1_9FIRM|nr:S1C family serine protease [Anaerocolumna jejuensis]SHL57266.1 serine protease, S1-C subfamily, contains C-terminal PDZ domain [Anaerocolumna jejuensis DSM 15929]
MPEDKSNKDSNEYLFIQEQISSKRRSRKVHMLMSLLWTIILACVFAVVAGVVFYLANPFIVKLLGEGGDKKTVEFPTLTPGAGENTGATATPTPTPQAEGQGGKDNSGKEPSKKPGTVYVETHVAANIKDLNNIYYEIREIASGVNSSIVDIACTSSKIDGLNENEKYDVTRNTTGIILANNSVDLLVLVTLDKIKDAKAIQLQINDELSVKAHIQDYDKELNLAVLSVSLEDIPDSFEAGLKPAELGESYSLLVGSPIIALGSPNGYVDSMELGIISGTDYGFYITDNKVDLFTTDISTNENSDGIIINMNGDVIGIITNKLKDEDNGNVSTVIGISKIKKTIQAMVNQTERSYFGVKCMDMSKQELANANLENAIYVTEVESNSPALKAGLQIGDMITAVNTTPISSVSTFNNTITALNPKDTVEVTIKRTIKDKEKEMKLSVVLGKVNAKK